MTESKDPFQIRSDEKAMNQRSTRGGVLNVVSDQRAAVLLFERMQVSPQSIGAAKLTIDESIGWLPFADFRSPPQWDPVEPQFIIDQSARAHQNWLRCLYMKMQPRGRNQFEAIRIREESKNLLDWPRQPEFITQDVRAA